MPDTVEMRMKWVEPANLIAFYWLSSTVLINNKNKKPDVKKLELKIEYTLKI